MKIAVIFVAVVLACIPLVARSFFKNEELKEKYFSVQDIFPSVAENVDIAVWLDKDLSKQIKPGDKLYYKQ